MSTMRATFDGKVFIPIGPVDLSAGQQIEFQLVPDGDPPRGSPAAVLAGMRGEPHLSAEDMDTFNRSLKEAELPGTLTGVFDEAED